MDNSESEPAYLARSDFITVNTELVVGTPLKVSSSPRFQRNIYIAIFIFIHIFRCHLTANCHALLHATLTEILSLSMGHASCSFSPTEDLEFASLQHGQKICPNLTLVPDLVFFLPSLLTKYFSVLARTFCPDGL
jgi:hypothetical protein